MSQGFECQMRSTSGRGGSFRLKLLQEQRECVFPSKFACSIFSGFSFPSVAFSRARKKRLNHEPKNFEHANAEVLSGVGWWGYANNSVTAFPLPSLVAKKGRFSTT